MRLEVGIPRCPCPCHWLCLLLLQWASVVVLLGWALFYRALFFATLKIKEWRSK